MTDDDPLDLAAVSADADALDALVRSGQLPEDLRDDIGLTLLHDLRREIDAEPMPLAPAVGSPSRSTVVQLSGDRPAGRRAARSGGAVALVVAGVLSLGGVAAASTTVAAGNPLYGLGQAVRSAAGTFADAVTPPQTDPVPPAPAAASPTPRPTPPGAAIAATARSSAAARQVTEQLDAAQQALADGRHRQAADRLDVAARRLPEVLPVHGAESLAARLADLRRQVAAAAATPQASEKAKPSRPSAPPRKPDAKPSAGPKKPAEQPEPAPKREGERPAADKKSTVAPESEAESSQSGAESAKGQPDEPVGRSGQPLGQPSRDASAKPRA